MDTNKYMRGYLKENYKRISMLLKLEDDRDIIEAIDNNRIQGSIKDLVRDGLKYRQLKD